jgi:hypothetical protein
MHIPPISNCLICSHLSLALFPHPNNNNNTTTHTTHTHKKTTFNNHAMMKNTNLRNRHHRIQTIHQHIPTFRQQTLQITLQKLRIIGYRVNMNAVLFRVAQTNVGE